MDFRGLERSRCDPRKPIRSLWGAGEGDRKGGREEKWVAWRRVEGVDPFYKHSGDTIGRTECGKTKDEGMEDAQVLSLSKGVDGGGELGVGQGRLYSLFNFGRVQCEVLVRNPSGHIGQGLQFSR